jgi:hypothetical protein
VLRESGPRGQAFSTPYAKRVSYQFACRRIGCIGGIGQHLER